MDLETKLAEARERSFTWPYGASPLYGFDAAAAIAREVVAEKDETIEVLRIEKRDLQIQIEQMAEDL